MFYQSIQLASFAPLLTLAAVIAILLMGIWRRYFSALSDIPGPFVASFSASWWQLWHIYTGHVEVALVEQHQKHGKFVRVGHNEVSVCEASAVRDVLLSHMNKGSRYGIFSMPNKSYTNQMAITNCKAHMAMAKNLAPSYSLTSVIKGEPYIDHVLQLLEARLDDLIATNTPVKFEEWFNYLAFDVLGEATFSQSFGFLEAGKDIGNTVANNVFLRLYISVLGHFPWAHSFILANPIIEYFKLTPAMHVFDTCLAAIEVRSKNTETRNDMLEQWKQQLKKHPDRMTEKDIVTTAVGNLGAGSDTVSSALQAFVYHMIHDTEMLAMLCDELDTARLSGIPSYDETQKLPVLQACIKETYRFHPPVGMLFARISPPEGVTVCGRYFNPGTTLSVNPWAIHRMTSLFSADAAKFNPRRWLDPEYAQKMTPYFIPFGAGYNQCPGRNLGHLEVSKTVAMLMRDYEIKLLDPSKEWKYENYITVAPHDWPCTIKRRSRRV